MADPNVTGTATAGAAMGAMKGAPAGPAGIAAGALIGGLLGALKGSGKSKEEQNQRYAQTETDEQECPEGYVYDVQSGACIPDEQKQGLISALRSIPGKEGEGSLFDQKVKAFLTQGKGGGEGIGGMGKALGAASGG